MKKIGTYIAGKSLLTAMMIILAFGPYSIAQAQNVNDTHSSYSNDSRTLCEKSLYLELGGKFLPSINYEIRKKENFLYTFGIGIWNDREEHPQWLFLPSFSAAYLFGQKNQFEIGAGAGPFISTYMGVASMMFFSNLAYRRPIGQRLLFRLSLNPFIGIPVADKSRFMIAPWGGISLGYTLKKKY